ncbi:MAG: restriction endonuclease subunit S [Syntrophotaleaceae bacterium]
MSKAVQVPDGWVKGSLSSFTECFSGGTPSRSKSEFYEGTIPWVKSGEVNNRFIYDTEEKISESAIRESSAKLVNPNSILVAMYGATAGKVAVLKVLAATNQAVLAMNPVDSNLCSDFLFWVMEYEAVRLMKKVQGAAQPNLSKNLIGNHKVTLPPLPEQKAIADLLATWDEAIEKTERLIQAKEANLKGQIQRIMGKEAIDANGWSMVHLGELFSEVTRKVGEKELTPYSISAGIGFVSQREKWGKDISGSQHKNYTHLKAGEFSYNKGNSKRYQQGCVYLLKDGEICVPNVFISFKPKAKNVVPEFFEHYFIADYHARELKRYITSGARSDGLLNLNKKEFFKIMVPCPSIEKQESIAEALTASQQEIDLLKQLAEKYKTQKRGLMQKMLTGEWRVKPEIVNQYMEA